MGNKVKLPSNFVRLPVIQDHLHESICVECENHILGQSRCTAHYQCEGSRCEDAYQMVEDDNEFIYYEFHYYPSKEVVFMEEQLDKRICQLSVSMYLDLSYLELIYKHKV